MRKTAFELYRYDIKDVQRSQVWFDEKIKSMNKDRVRPNSILLKDQGEHLTSTIKPAMLCAFYYWPKGHDTLPYFDTFPLVFPFGSDSESFTALNMHYLNYPDRFALFKKLLDVSGNTSINEHSKMNLNWQLIKGISKTKNASACVKKYLFSHVKSPFLPIQPQDWTTAMMMPLARFQGANEKTVWKESRKL
jgi:hypothetical protein